MKKLLFMALFVFALLATGVGASAESTGIRYYDVSAYINNYPIPCYNVHDYCGVYAKDLRMYGFNVEYDEGLHRVNITRNRECTEISGIDGVKLPWQKSGTLSARSQETDIKVFLEDKEIYSCCVSGNMMVLLDDFGSCGEVVWSGELKSLFLTIEGISQKEFVPLEKTQPRYKPASCELDYNSYYNYPSEECDWGFVRVEGDEPSLPGWQKTMIEKFGGYYLNHNRPHAIYLTFDEGYEEGYTQQILDTLSKYNVPATFFVTGEYLNTSADLVRQMIDRGFTVGNHTQNHKNLAQCDIGTVMNEIEIVSNRLRSEFGYESYYMRPPEGAVSERALAIAKDLGFNTILWSFAYYDYEPSVQKGSNYAYDMITRYMHDGAVYLLHAVSRDNANVLESVIQYALDNGYELRSLDDLCGLK